jgi:N-carbamoyl-L-amino-acid hydrolase
VASDAVLRELARDDIHYTAQFSAPSPGGVTRLCADENDKLARDWFREQVLALGAEYKVGMSSSVVNVVD